MDSQAFLLILSCALGPVLATDKELAALYEDCKRYEDESFFGGPVCGTDGKTYANQIYLSCLNFKKPDHAKIKIASVGSCPMSPGSNRCFWSPIYSPVCGSDNQTYANVEALNCSNKIKGGKNNSSFEKIIVKTTGECCRQDPCIGGFPWGSGPVCASNRLTYESPASLHCLRKFHSDLDIVHEGGCSVDEVATKFRSRSQLCALARNRYEWNPVCAINNLTYINPYVFLCYTPHLRHLFSGECSSNSKRSCSIKAFFDSHPEKLHKDARVCGTDGQNYPSIHHLVCEAQRNKYLRLNHNGPCKAIDNPCQKLSQLHNNGQPVCGSDGVTYVSPEALYCVQRTIDEKLRYVHDGVCLIRKFESQSIQEVKDSN